MTVTMDAEVVKNAVRKAYGAIASGPVSSGGCCGGGSGCGTPTPASAIGYSAAEEASAPEGANLGLGCGNPLAQAEPAENMTCRPSDIRRATSTPSRRRLRLPW